MIPAFATGLLDDAAMFPPGSLPLDAAVPAHRRHRAAPHAPAVGPLVVAATALPTLHAILAETPGAPLAVALTAPDGPAQALDALRAADPALVDVVALEIAVPDDPAAFFAGLGTPGPDVYAEIPRDARRDDVLAGLAATGHRAKFRTGGVTADLYPGVDELAAAISAAVAAGVPFKATAGLHRAVRATDPATGFDQHGFLNLLLAAHAARTGGDVAAALAERDPAIVAAAVADAAPARRSFLSFGTCSVREPLDDLAALGLIPAGDPA